MPRFAVAAFCALSLFAQRQTGELRLQVTDPAGAAIEASGEVVSQATHTHQHFTTGRDGLRVFAALPFGVYQITVEGSGFQPYSALVEIRSQAPVVRRVTLGIAPIETVVRVAPADTLLNPDRTGATQQIGAEELRDRRSATPARAIPSLVDSQPGWLLEANGVLHPRGSEYGVQYVVDGLPLVDNRSPAFAPSLEVEEFQSMAIRTGGYPAEYGHQLGGVIEVTTARDPRPGIHGKVVAEGGSFATASGAASVQFGTGRNIFGIGGDGMRTDRYLDPPVERNFTNHGSGGGVSARWERDWSAADRMRISVRRSRAGFLVPNELIQEQAGQRQDRTAAETSGQLAYTHLISPRVLFDVRGSGREVEASLWSNAHSTPIAPEQLRGFREGYAVASVSANLGAHEIKAGGEALLRSVHEQFGFLITAYRLGGVRIFDRDTPSQFDFSDSRWSREQGAYIQDQVRIGRLTVNAGVRWDRYSLLVRESAWSPRLAAAWQPGGGLVLRVSYDRAFQTPAVENLLLASSAAVRTLNDNALSLPVRPSRGNFYEAGFAKSIFGRARLDASWFRRRIDDFADDDVLLNTGVSFPIAFRSADIQGFEAKLEIPQTARLSGFLSYTNMTGRGHLPIAGGLFLEDNVAGLLTSNEVFPVTQDQRNSARGRLRFQVLPRFWAAAAAQYGSGLPVELDDSVNLSFLAQQYGSRVLDRVDVERGRVRPSFSVDLSAGADLWKHEQSALRVQADCFNVTDRLNVINFAGVFSGTALAPGRWAAVRVSWEW